MAFTLSADAQLVFFNKVFGQASPTTERVKALLEMGVSFEVSLYTIRATVGKKVLEPVKLTYGTTSLMKGTADALIAAQNKKLIEDWVSFLYAKQGSLGLAIPKPKPVTTPWAGSTIVVLTGVQPGSNKLPVIKAVHQHFGGGKALAESAKIVEYAQGGQPQPLSTFSTYEKALEASIKIVSAGGESHLETVGGQKVSPHTVTASQPVVTPKPVNAVIDLKNAAALGQKVHGTSTGSVYHTIAIGQHVKVAARLSAGGSVSIRAEWTDNPTDELKKLSESGVQMKTNYGSIHFDAADVPLQRVIGAFLLGTGINWKAVVTNGAELVIG